MFNGWLRGGSLTKSEETLLYDVVFPLFICEKGEEEGQNWKISKHVLFESPHTNFKHHR